MGRHGRGRPVPPPPGSGRRRTATRRRQRARRAGRLAGGVHRTAPRRAARGRAGARLLDVVGRLAVARDVRAVARHQLQEIAVHTYDAQPRSVRLSRSPTPWPSTVSRNSSPRAARRRARGRTSPVVDYAATEGRSWRLWVSGAANAPPPGPRPPGRSMPASPARRARSSSPRLRPPSAGGTDDRGRPRGHRPAHRLGARVARPGGAPRAMGVCRPPTFGVGVIVRSVDKLEDQAAAGWEGRVMAPRDTPARRAVLAQHPRGRPGPRGQLRRGRGRRRRLPRRGGGGRSDTGAGTAAVPFCTIAKAAKVAVAGQTVLVSLGDVRQVFPWHSGTAGSPITSSRPRARSSPSRGPEHGFTISNQSWITVSGFTVRDTTSNASLDVFNATGVRLSNNTARGSGSPWRAPRHTACTCNSMTGSARHRQSSPTTRPPAST